MMQLVCNGSRLDLYENTDLQFTEENPLFAFDSIKCERTTNFKLPATPANDRVFALARIPAYAGEGMRRKFPAQLQQGTIVKDGYLYVSSWSGKEYEAIFVTGEMVGLQQLRDAGKLADLVSYATIQWSPAYVRDANTAAGRAPFAITRYKTNANLCMPSYDFAEILDEAYHYATLQTGAWYLPDKVSGMRVIAKEINSLGKLPFTFQNTPAEVAPAEVTPSSAPTAGSITFTYQYATLFARVYKPVQAAKTVSGATHAYYIKVQHLICGQTILLTMPDDISPDLFLMSIEPKNGGGQGDPTDPEYTPLAQEWFLGDYSFNYNVAQGSGIVVSGIPLAGKTIKIPARTPFVFINKNAFKWQQQGIDFLDGLWNVGFSGAPGMAYSVTMQSEGASVEQGDVIRIEQVISDITLCDALKIYANLIGKQLYYTDKDGVQFDDLFFISWPRFDISKRLLSIGKVTRTFSDYAQHNLVQFDSADDVPQNTRVVTEYTLDNDNISETKEVGKIPFNEGEIDAADGVIVARFDADDVEKNTLPKYGIAVAGQSQYMERMQLPKNAGIQALCDASTQVEVQARMSAYEYAQINAKTRILCRGTEYVWTSRSWQKDTAKFVLAKLPLLNTYGLTYDTIQTLVADYGESVVMAVISYVSTRTAIVSYINENPVIARYVCNIIEPDDSYPYYTTTRVAFPNIISTLQTTAKFGFSQNTASGEIVPLWFGIYGGQNYGYCGYNYNSNQSRLYGFHGNGTSGNFVNVYMDSAIPLGSYIMMELSHSFVRVKVGSDEKTTQYTGNWFGNRLAYLYNGTTGTPRLYFSQIFDGNIEQHRLFKLQDGRYWNSIQGRFEQTA